ncbi:MAG: magnesium transporter CorA family protein [Thermoanaerobaculaceae bacterium]|nr:magnesium transporter CorA family protein [Thermoanaerobaculaceae bacterium]
MSECRYFHVEAGKGMRRVGSLEEALAARGGGYIWADLFDPAREELDAVAGSLGIHPLAVEDCFDSNQVPKVEDYPGFTFILFNRYSYRDRQLGVEEVDLFFGKGFLVSVSGLGGGERTTFERTEAIAARGLATVERGPDFLLHVILDVTVDGKVETIEPLEDDIEAAEEGILRDVTGFRLEGLVKLRRALLSLRKSLFHEREILVKICRRDSPFVSEEAIYHFRDIYDHLAKFFEFTEMNRDLLANLTEMYLSLINNRMARVANRTNKSVRRLTLITTIFMPLSLLAGIGGMSEWSMMTGPENWRFAYPAFAAAMVLIGAASYLLLKRVERREGNHRDRS